MKKSVFVLTSLLTLIASATPDRVRCGNSSSLYQIDVQILGSQGGGVVLESTPAGQLPIEVTCLTKNQAVPAAGATKQYVCGTQEEPEMIEIYKRSKPYIRWAVVYKVVVSGQKDPITLSCN